MAPRDSSAGCPAEKQTLELTFDGVPYILVVRCASGDCLEVMAERKEDASTWSAVFAAKYVEEITAKTGSFKRFPVFVKMLLSALRQESDSVSLDLLTSKDLDVLRSKRASSVSANTTATQVDEQQQQQQQQQPVQAPPLGATSSIPPNKRYLILTYAAEYDRVHYPLPLAYEDQPDTQRLKDTIRQLRSQLAAAPARAAGGMGRRGAAGSLQAAAGEVKQLQQENAALQRKVVRLEAAGSGAALQEGGGASLAADVQQLAAEAQEAVSELRAMRRERDGLLARLQAAEAALEGVRSLHRRELRRRDKEVADVSAELAAAKDQVRQLRLSCRELTRDLDLAQRSAKVTGTSASVTARQLPLSGRPAGGGGHGSRSGATPSRSRCASPAGGCGYLSGQASPATSRRVPLPGPPRSRSADVRHPASKPSSRPGSAGRFDPTQYVQAKREREREAARRLDDVRRAARLQSPQPRSLQGSTSTSRHSTPQRSRVPSRDPSADRARQLARERDAQRRGERWEWGARGAAQHSGQRLRADMHGTATLMPACTRTVCAPAREQQSPGRALLEVGQRLRRYAASSVQQRGGPSGSSTPCSAALQQPAAQQQAVRSQGATRAAAQRGRMQWTGDHYADASAEIADIDGRLQSLQDLLRASKAGQAAAVPG